MSARWLKWKKGIFFSILKIKMSLICWNWIPFTQDSFSNWSWQGDCTNLYKECSVSSIVVLEKIFKYCQHSYVQISPLGNGRGPAFEKNLILLKSKDVLCQVDLKLARWFWRRRWKWENGQMTDNISGQKSSLKLSALVS